MRLLAAAALGTIVALIPLLARAETEPAPAEIVSAANGVQDVVRAQLNAIRNRDADAAYALMTHDFHDVHEDARGYLGTLRFQNRAIYNHKDFTFLDQQSSGATSLQKVRLTDHFGQPVTVIYRLEQQDDGSWLIDSFTVLDSEAQPI